MRLEWKPEYSIGDSCMFSEDNAEWASHLLIGYLLAFESSTPVSGSGCRQIIVFP
jgi:hypothetical protein